MTETHKTHDSEILNKITKNEEKKIILVGNPNVGKSAIFNLLTETYVDVSNFPGTTVDITTGHFEGFSLIDTPGVYGISAFNDEEKVTRDALIYSDNVINVVDAVNLERDLFLTQHIIDMGKSLVVVVNMIDEMEKKGITIDFKGLEKALGVPVVPISTYTKEGVEEMKKAIHKGGKIGNKMDLVEELLPLIIEKVDFQVEAVLALEEDPYVLDLHHLENVYKKREALYEARRIYVNKILEGVFKHQDRKRKVLDKFGDLMLKPLYGIPILAGILVGLYFLIGVFVAQTVVGVTEGVLMGHYYNDFILNITSGFLDSNTFIGNLLIGEFGVLTMLPIYLFGLLFPLIISFYFIMALLEDSGIMPRIAVLVDRALTGVGLNGKSIIPIILGFGCVTMALVTTRILGSKRERIIATILLCVAVPCSAQLGVIMSVAATLSPGYVLFYVAVLILVFGILGFGLNKIMPGKSTPLLIDVPQMRAPQLKNITKKTWIKTKHFMKEAGPIFAVGSVLISVLSYTGGLEKIIKFTEPLITHWLRLPAQTAQVFVMGLVRRDFGVAGLNQFIKEGLLTDAQSTIALIVLTLFIPCIASIMMLFKERKPHEAVMIWVLTFTVAFTVGGAAAALLI